MFEELRKKSFKKCLFTAILLLIAGICMVAYSAVNVFYTFFGYADFAKLEPDKIKFQLVQLDLDFNLGCYLEEYEYNTKTHARKTTDLYYIILTGDETSEDVRAMTIKVPPTYKKTMNALADGTATSTTHFIGKIKKLDSKEYNHFKKCFLEDFGFTEEQFEQFTLPYYIDYYHDATSVGVLYCLLFFGGLALFAAGVLRIVKGKKGGFLKNLRNDISLSGYSDSYVESDYAAAQQITKGDELKMGRLMTYYNTGAEYRAIPHNKVMWAYQSTTTHRTNGVKTGTTYSVIYYIEGVKNSSTVSVPNEAAAQEVLRKLATTCPWIIVGYTDELNRLFRKSRMEFVQLRYNTVEHTPVDPAYVSAESQNTAPSESQSTAVPESQSTETQAAAPTESQSAENQDATASDGQPT